MIDFKQLVMEALNTALYEYYKDTAALTHLRPFLTRKFNINSSWPAPESVFGNLASISIRGGVEALTRVAEYFPLFDFVWHVAEQIDTSQISKILATTPPPYDVSSVIQNLENDFVSKCDRNNPGNSLDPVFGYIPVSATGNRHLRTLEKKLSNNVVGKLSLNSFNSFSIKKTMYGLLENRKKIRKSVNAAAKIPDSNKYVDNILANPGDFVGKKQVPAELNSLYNIPSLNAIIELAVTIHNFYESELARFNIWKRTVPKNTFNNFITNAPLDSAGNFIITSQISGMTSPTVHPAEPLPGKGGYTIFNIKNINSPASKSLIEELERFANYISEGEPPVNWKNVAQSLGQLGQGLSSLTTKVGL